MSLNKLLCKYFDDGEKGYVTVEDVLDGIIWRSIPFILAALYLHGAISMYNLIYTPDYLPPSEILFVFGMGVFSLGSILAMFEGLGYAIPKILGARVAKSERKDGDETS